MHAANFSTDELLTLSNDYLAQNYAPLPVMLARGEGSWVWDVEGNRYLDLLSAYSALNFGHKNPRLVARAVEQLTTLALTSRAFHSEQLCLFAKELVEFCDLERVVLMNSGTEAVETALKVARRWGYEKKGVPANEAEIIVFSRNFHGRSISIVGFSDSSTARDGFGPFPAGFTLCPYGDAECLEAFITDRTVGVLVEPVQGEGGINIPGSGYLTAARKLCDQHHVLLMIDEIQTGLCRTGEVFAYQHEDIKPDLLILGKSLGGGLIPVSAVVGSDDALSVLTPGTHGSTFGGNPLACAVGREVLRLITEEKPQERARKLGSKVVEQLRSLKTAQIKEVRGLGLLIGIEFYTEAGSAKDFGKKLLHERVLTKDTRKQTLRIAPPLTISDEEMEWGLEALNRVLKE